MPIFHNIDGRWTPQDTAPTALDRATGRWDPVARVYAHAQGRWRAVWPDPVTTVTTITVEPQHTVWPQPAMVRVDIGQTFPTGPLEGVVVVTSTAADGAWEQQFTAAQQTAVLTLPVREPGEYRVDAVWSEDDDVTGSGTYRVAPAQPVMAVLPGTLHLNAGERAACIVQVRLNGEPLPAGGYVEYRQQESVNGEYGPYKERRPYPGSDMTYIVTAEQSSILEFRFAEHPDASERRAQTRLWVRQEILGMIDVQATAAATYRGDGGLRQASFPIYHGYWSAQYGPQRGLFWLPPLPVAGECTKVVMEWYPQQTNIKPPSWAKMMVGYHNIPPGTGGIDYRDPRIREAVIPVTMQTGKPLWIELPEAAAMVNRLQGEPCGIVVGHGSIDPSWYGYGYPRQIRYHYRTWG